MVRSVTGRDVENHRVNKSKSIILSTKALLVVAAPSSSLEIAVDPRTGCFFHYHLLKKLKPQSRVAPISKLSCHMRSSLCT
jgi:hypothetical protein